MKRFKQFLTEGKNTHLTHLEDVILEDGAKGLAYAVDVLRAFGKMLDGGRVSKSLNVSVKWDGSPAVVFGPDPADGRFFVSTKAAFNKTPKLAKSHAEISALFDANLASILHTLFDELPSLNSKHILQGDVLFTGPVSIQTISGKDFLTFQPNTILYAVDAESELGKQINQANVGIVLHTVYTGSGKALSSYQSSALSPSVYASLTRSRGVLTLDARYDDLSGTVTFTEEEQADFLMSLDEVYQAGRNVSDALFDSLQGEPLRSFLSQFINVCVRNSRIANVSDFLVFLSDKSDMEKGTRSTPAGQAAVVARFKEMLNAVHSMQRQFTNWFKLHQALARAKNIVVHKLGQASSVNTFVKTDSGFRVTGPEGFVAVAHSGKAVKLVDRLEFSRLNFLQARNWQ